MLGRITDAATVLLVLCAALIVARKVTAPSSAPLSEEWINAEIDSPRIREEQNRLKVSAAKFKELKSAGSRVGRTGSATTLVIFSSYACRACAILSAMVDTLINVDSADIAVVYRHFVADSAEIVRRPHLLAECAHKQGKLLEFNRLAFTAQHTLNGPNYAMRAGVAIGVADPALFRDCVDRRFGEPALARDSGAIAHLGLNVTPTFYLNGLAVVGTPSLATLRRLIEIHRASE